MIGDKLLESGQRSGTSQVPSWTAILISILLLLPAFQIVSPFSVSAETTISSETFGIAASDTFQFDDQDDLVFMHHSVGQNWLNSGLNTRLLEKEYVDERNDIYYSVPVSNVSGRPNSLGSPAGNYLDMNHWILWFNDYLGTVKTIGASDGENRIIMFKSCYPNSNVFDNGTGTGNPFSGTRTIANNQAIYRHPSGANNTYSWGGYTYKPLEDIFTENPNTLFIALTPPPLQYGPPDSTTDARALNARSFNTWLREDWLPSYNQSNQGLNNVAVFDFFDILAYPSNHTTHPNRLRYEYGGSSGNSHPNTAGNVASTIAFANGTDNFLDSVWDRFNSSSSNSPTDLEYTIGDGFVNLNWTAPDGSSGSNLTGYRVYRGNTSGNRTLLKSLGNTTSYNDTSVVNGGRYFYHVNAMYSQNESDNSSVIEAFDYNKPVINNVSFSPTPHMGDNVTISVNATDNVAVSNVSIEYWYPGEDHQNSTLTNTMGSTWNHTLSLSDNHTAFYYNITATDHSGNHIFRTGNEVMMADSVRPSFHDDGSAGIAYTGDAYSFNITISDNVGVNKASVEYWYGNGSHHNSTMTGIGGVFLHNMTVDDTLDTLYYLFHAEDIAGNWNNTGTTQVDIEDNDDPAISLDCTCHEAFTGDQHIFTVEVYDNIAASSVVVEYWFGNGVHTNLSLSKGQNNTWTGTVSIPSDSLQNLTHVFHALDSSGNGQASGHIIVTVRDNDLPAFGTDSTQLSGTTGDLFLFQISVSDNIDIDEVSVEYWFGAGAHTNSSMSGTGPFTHTLHVPSGDLNDIHYIFHASDSAGNWIKTTARGAPISDNDPPVLSSDLTPQTATTGDPFTFSAQVSDNIGIHTVSVEYWYEQGAHINTTMAGSGAYSLAITIPSGSIDLLSYIFHFNDSAGNWNETSREDVQIRDNDRPTLSNDLTPTTATTGDPFTFSIMISDNIDPHTVTVEYWYGSGTHVNTTMTGTGTYSLTITIPSASLDELNYIFHANDSSGNWNETSEEMVSVNDNDRPTFSNDLTPTMATTGDPFTFSIMVSDNIDPHTVTVEYWYGSETHVNTTMTGTGTYSLTITIPSASLDDLNYIIHANDSSGNWNGGPMKAVSVYDNDRPEPMMDHTSGSAFSGEDFTFSIELKDNIRVDSAWVNYIDEGGKIWNISISLGPNGRWTRDMVAPLVAVGHYSYAFHFNDTSDNWNHTSIRTISFSDNSPPLLLSDTSDPDGTTGEEFILELEVSDNVGISGLFVEYWFGDGDHMNDSLSYSSSMNVGSGSITIPTSSLDGLHYRFHANDTADNWMTGPEVVVEIFDNDDPTLKEVDIVDEAVMGSLLTFRLWVRDNIGVRKVDLEYRYGVGEDAFAEMLVDEDNWTYSIRVLDSPEKIYYLVKAVDMSGNEVSHEGEITLLDRSAVEILEDLTPTEVEIGQDLEFSVWLSDNMEISTAYVEFGYENETTYNMSLSDDDGDDIYSYSHTSLYRSGLLWYVIKAVDLSGNWNVSSGSYVALMDGKGPIAGKMVTVGAPSTGESIDVKIEWLDDISISDAWIEYWFGEGLHINDTMERLDHDMFTFTIEIPDTIEELNLIFRSRDTSDNWAEMVGPTIQLIDNDPPLISVSDILKDAYTGEAYYLEFQVLDNLEIAEIGFKYNFGYSIWTELEIDPTGQTLTASIPIPEKLVRSLTVIITVKDRAGNRAESVELAIPIIDIIDPSLEPMEDVVMYLGQNLKLSALAKDNLRVESIIWSWDGGEIEGVDLDWTPPDAGTYVITLSAGDMAGNLVSIRFEVVVLDVDHDEDEDGLADLFELEMGLDPDDPDTDGDGMPDGWEVDHGLDASASSAGRDTDNDGITDLEEFEKGTDPTVSSKESGGDGISPLWLLALLLILVLLGALGWFRFRRKEYSAPPEQGSDSASGGEVGPDGGN